MPGLWFSHCLTQCLLVPPMYHHSTTQLPLLIAVVNNHFSKSSTVLSANHILCCSTRSTKRFPGLRFANFPPWLRTSEFSVPSVHARLGRLVGQLLVWSFFQLVLTPIIACSTDSTVLTKLKGIVWLVGGKRQENNVFTFNATRFWATTRIHNCVQRCSQLFSVKKNVHCADSVNCFAAKMCGALQILVHLCYKLYYNCATMLLQRNLFAGGNLGASLQRFC